MLNESIRWHDDELYCDAIPVGEIAGAAGTPVYIYSLRRAVANLRRIQTAFGGAGLHPHVHYSAKANANLAVLRALIAAGAGIDAVSYGEIFKALRAGAAPEKIVFAGVGKTAEELALALEAEVGWFNVETADELILLERLASERGRPARVALRLNPDVQAHTHRHIATGHGAAKFGLPVSVATDLLARQGEFPHICFAGIHTHIGSQLHDIDPTLDAVRTALALIAPYPTIQTVNIGGGLPVAYTRDEELPALDSFARALAPLLAGREVIIEPGRSVIADAGILVTRVLYLKQHAGQTLVIVDAGMTELIRPALYEAHHEVVRVAGREAEAEPRSVTVVGPVCETTDVLARDANLSGVRPGDLLAILTAGAYGMVMASGYNARRLPAEVVVAEDGQSWHVARRRQTWDDLLAFETDGLE